jgi:hypothetical protein
LKMAMELPQMFERLLARPQPLDGESQWGFWLRLANENGLQRPQWLLGEEARWPAGLARLCPVCLTGAKAMWCQEWLSAGVYWCRCHLTWLVDECPACCRRLRWSSVCFQECQCGFDLRGSEAAGVDRSIVTAVSMGSAPLDVLRLLGAFVLYGPSGKLGKKVNRAAMKDARAQVQAGIGLVSEWPQGFFRALDRYRVSVAVAGTAQLLREAFPGLVEVTTLTADETWRLKLSSAIDAYCARSLSGDAPIIGRSEVLSASPMTIKEISARLGKRVEAIAQAIDGADAPVGFVRVTPKGRRRRVVRDADVTRLATVLSEPIAVKAAARKLALPASRVNALVRAGLLSSKDGRLVRSELTALATLPLLTQPGAASGDTPAVPLRKALRDWAHMEDTAALVNSLRSGELSVIASTQLLAIGEWLVSAAAVQAWTAGRRAKPATVLSLSQAAVELGLKHDVVRDLVRSGLIPAVKGSMRHRSSWLVAATDLAAFSTRYVPLSMLARAAGVRCRDGFDWALSNGLKLVCGPRIDGSRQYFADRVALTQLPVSSIDGRGAAKLT